MNNTENRKCENCIWGNRCEGDALTCEDYSPADTDMAMDYEVELQLEYERSLYAEAEDEYDYI